MWVNLKPYTVQMYNPVSVPYTVGITGKNNAIAQKTSTHLLKPGQHISINVFPQLVSSSVDFNGLDLVARQCKLRQGLLIYLDCRIFRFFIKKSVVVKG